MKKSEHPYRILLYYKYVKIEDHETYASIHLKFCKSIGVKGRILVAEEGINGTLSGTVEQAEAYIYAMRMDPRFRDMEYKIDEADEHAFKKLYVRPRSEIVTMDLEVDLDPNEITGKRLKPKEFLEAMQEDDVVIIDARNDYEYDIGHFRNAIRPDVKNFKQFPEWINKNKELLQDKKILAYCTGGVRCEKFSGLLKREGFENVNQLKGGIISYGKHPDTKGKLFDGKCYVFDERIAVRVNFTDEDIIVSKCKHCGEPCDRYINCSNALCHDQYFCCEKCDEKFSGACSKECAEKQLVVNS